MQEQVLKYICGCVMCYTSRPSNRKLGLYILPILNRHWENISMDFAGGFSMSNKGNDYLFILVDNIQKYMCFKSL